MVITVNGMGDHFSVGPRLYCWSSHMTCQGQRTHSCLWGYDKVLLPGLTPSSAAPSPRQPRRWCARVSVLPPPASQWSAWSPGPAVSASAAQPDREWAVQTHRIQQSPKQDQWAGFGRTTMVLVLSFHVSFNRGPAPPKPKQAQCACACTPTRTSESTVPRDPGHSGSCAPRVSYRSSI